MGTSAPHRERREYVLSLTVLMEDLRVQVERYISIRTLRTKLPTLHVPSNLGVKPRRGSIRFPRTNVLFVLTQVC